MKKLWGKEIFPQLSFRASLNGVAFLFSYSSVDLYLRQSGNLYFPSAKVESAMPNPSAVGCYCCGQKRRRGRGEGAGKYITGPAELIRKLMN